MCRAHKGFPPSLFAIRLSALLAIVGASYCLVSSRVVAAPIEIELRSQSTNRFVQELAVSLKRRLAQQSEKYTIRDRSDVGSALPAVTITLGSEAFKAAIVERPRRRILAAAIARPSFVAVLESEGLTSETASDIAGIFVGQSVRHNLALSRAVFPKAETACAFDTKNIPFKNPAMEASRKFGFTTIAIPIESPLDVLQKLEPVLSRCDFLWITHDTSAITGETIRPLLLMTLRRGKPVLGGVIPDFVEQGALATISSTNEHLENEIVNRLEVFQRSRTLGASSYSSEWKIWINRRVAETLNIEVADDQVLRERVVRALLER
jgi:ABC-type uncharacterized transport system substrate-binding protein